MIEILKYCFITLAQFINGIYNIELEYTAGHNIKIGTLFVAFFAFFVVLYYVCRALGLIDKGGE